MSFLPPLIPELEEVQPENLIKDKEYLINFTSYDNQNVRQRGNFQGIDGDYYMFKLPSVGNMNAPFSQVMK